ncbi:MAG: hypothetical protein PQJ59_06645 [Spirochaetales bacterium]|nr:hypothetical protein [Spirochaetales bacterium]
MFRPTIVLLLCFAPIGLEAYTPPEKLNGSVKSVYTYKQLLREIPAGTMEEPWLLNIEYDEEQRPTVQRYYRMGQEYRRHEFRYETDREGRERTTWLTYISTPDLRPPAERLAGYEHWYSLEAGEDVVETRFETVQDHPVKSVFRYYDGENRLVRETDSFQDLDVEINYDEEGRLSSKRGYREERTFWNEWYLYDEEGRLVSLIQSDLNRQLYERGEYSYGQEQILFSKYVLDRPITPEMVWDAPLETPVFQSVKDYDREGRLVRLRNYNWNGPYGLMLTEENHYSYDDEGRLEKVVEPHSLETWTLSWDERGNWVYLSYRDELNRPGEEISWRREIVYRD